MSRLIDLSGQSFNRLTVTGRSSRVANTGALWECLCDCGNTVVVDSLKLRNGLTKSCGCHRTEATTAALYKHGHGGQRTRTYRTWKEMRQRCNNPNSDQWKWYGGRGISIWERWSAFENFLADMGERPIGKTLDRLDPDGNYEPGNCRWATAKQQAETNRGVFRSFGKPTDPLVR